MTLTLGWWIAPLIITLAALAWARREDRRARRGVSDFGRSAAAMLGLIAYLVAVVVALIAWLVWSLLA